MRFFLIDGFNGNVIQTFNSTIPLDDASIKEIPSPIDDGTTLFVLDTANWLGSDLNAVNVIVYSITTTSQELIWSIGREQRGGDTFTLVLNDDFNGDSISEILLYESIERLDIQSEVNRYTVFSVPDREVLSIINIETSARELISIHDFDGDGRRDCRLKYDPLKENNK